MKMGSIISAWISKKNAGQDLGKNLLGIHWKKPNEIAGHHFRKKLLKMQVIVSTIFCQTACRLSWRVGWQPVWSFPTPCFPVVSFFLFFFFCIWQAFARQQCCFSWTWAAEGWAGSLSKRSLFFLLCLLSVDTTCKANTKWYKQKLVELGKEQEFPYLVSSCRPFMSRQIQSSWSLLDVQEQLLSS